MYIPFLIIFGVLQSIFNILPTKEHSRENSGNIWKKIGKLDLCGVSSSYYCFHSVSSVYFSYMMALLQALWKLHYTDSPWEEKKKKSIGIFQCLVFPNTEAHFTSEFSKQTLRCCFITGLSYPKYGACQEAGPLTTFLPLLVSDLGKYSSCFIISSHAASEAD